jgi:hypothetical protein
MELVILSDECNVQNNQRSNIQISLNVHWVLKRMCIRVHGTVKVSGGAMRTYMS